MKKDTGRDIKDVVVLLATQAMINLGELANPISKEKKTNPEAAKIFIDLLKVLKEKTVGNLNQEEDTFLEEAINNLTILYTKKEGAEN
jgi:hypothetical protein